MTDDLVKRLRESGSMTEVELHEDREEAADRIEADASRIKETTDELNLQIDLKTEAEARAEAAEARVKVLEEACSPLMQMEVWTETAEDDEYVIVTVGTVRQIRNALEGDN